MAGSALVGELTNSTARGLALAGAGDDAALRALLRRTVLPGAVRVAFTREPDYFAGEGLAGAEDVTVVARRDGSVVAMGRYSVHRWHRNGRVQRIGYLGELRIAPGTPSAARLLRDGYAFLADVASRDHIDGFVTSITDDNVRARRVLEQGRRFGLPSYRVLAPLVTLLAPVHATVSGSAGSTRTIDAMCRPDEVDELTGFLRGQAEGTQLSLAWNAEQWTALARHGVTAGDFCVVRREGRIVGAAAVWDQRAFRQTIVDGYSGVLQLALPLLNMLQAVRGRPSLPRPGSVLPQGALLGACVQRSSDWSTLWPALLERARTMGLSWLAITRASADPELAILRRLARAREYRTSLYHVIWRDRPTWSDPWDTRIVRPEVGLL